LHRTDLWFILAILTWEINFKGINKLKTIVAAVWLGTLGLAFAFGYHWHNASLQNEENIATTNTDAKLTNPKRNLQDISGQKLPTSNATLSDNLISNPADKDPDANQTVLSDVIGILQSGFGQDLGSIAAAYNLITDMSEADLLTNLEYLSAFADNPEYMLTLSLFLDRYASMEPYQALTFVLDNITAKQSRQSFVNLTLSKWSQKEPKLALDWYSSNKEELPARFNPILGNIFASLAKQDQDLAIRYLQDYTNDLTSLSAAIRGITSGLNESTEYASLLDKTAYLDSSNARSGIIGSWLNAHPEDTLDWFAGLPELPKKAKIEEEIFTSYMYSNSSDAADWYLARAEPDKVQNRVNKILEKWHFSDPQYALEWINQQTSIDTQQATQKLLSAAAFGNPTFVIDKLHLLKSDGEKANVSARIFLALMGESTSKARLFFEASPYKKEILKQEAAMRKYREQK
jgi:hypothetical protein